MRADASWFQEFDLDPDSPFAKVSQNTETITKVMQPVSHDRSEAVYFYVSCVLSLVPHSVEGLTDISERNVEQSVHVPRLDIF